MGGVGNALATAAPRVGCGQGWEVPRAQHRPPCVWDTYEVAGCVSREVSEGWNRRGEREC